MAEEENTLENLLSKFVLIQSKFEYETHALESLLEIAKNQAESENSPLVYILEALQQKAQIIKNIVLSKEN